MSVNAFIEESAKEILRDKVTGQGKVFIESLGEVDVAGFAKAQVSAADTVIPDNIKDGEIILGVQGNYDGKVSLSFETAPFRYSDLTEEQKDRVGEGEIPLFSFTNIKSRGLSDNEVYLTANVNIDLNVGDTIRTNPVYHSGEDYNFLGEVFEVTPDQVFDSHYVYDSEGELKDRYFDFDYYEKGETEYDPLTCKYDINLYIAEKRADGDDTYYTIKEKATNSINAYFLGSVYFSIVQGDFEYGVDKSKVFIEFSGEDSGQSIEWATSGSEYGPDLTRLLYGHKYRVHAYSTDELLVIDGVGEEGVDIQDTTINYPQDIINFGKNISVWIINNHIKPVENFYVRDEASDVEFYLFKMNGTMPSKTIFEGDGLEIGQEYSVGFSMMPLSQKSDIYINGSLVASNVTYYEFTLTEDMVVDNQVVIKVVKAKPSQKDYITIDNTNSTSLVSISGDSPFGSWSHIVMTGTTYNLSAQQYMMTPVVNFTISSENDATWQAKDSEEIITLNKFGNNTILDPNGNSTWYIPDSVETGYMGTITFTSEGPIPPTPGTYITIDNTQGNTEIYIEGSSSGTSVESYSQASFETSGTTRYKLSGKPQGGVTVTFTGTYNGKYRSNSKINIYSGYLVNPETSEYDWMSGTNGTITIVTGKK